MKLFPKRTFLLMCVCFLGGCASMPAPYRERKSMSSDGYSNSTTSLVNVEITYVGSQFSSKQRVRDFAYLRAAELTMEAGHRYFFVINELIGKYAQSHTIPSSPPGSTVYLPGSTPSSFTPSGIPGGVIKIHVNTARLKIRILTGPIPENTDAVKTIDANVLIKELKAKYGIKD